MEFKDAKKELLKLAKDACACQDEYKKALKSETPAELLATIKNNAHWCITENVISVELLEKWFGASVLAENYLFISGENAVEVIQDAVIVLLGSSSANVKTWGSSSANVETLGSSSANVKTWGSSSANVKTWGSSSANVKTLDSSSANVETWDSSSANVETWDSSSANVETWDSSSANVKTLDSSSANVETWDSSSANVETWDSSSANVKTWGSSSKLTYTQSGGIMRDLGKRRIFIKKSDFEISIIE
jgi:hypothetical protein